jgi:hypothetical protein
MVALAKETAYLRITVLADQAVLQGQMVLAEMEEMRLLLLRSQILVVVAEARVLQGL